MAKMLRDSRITSEILSFDVVPSLSLSTPSFIKGDYKLDGQKGKKRGQDKKRRVEIDY